MRLLTMVGICIIITLLSACGRHKEAFSASASASAQIDPPPAFKIAEDQRKQLDNAKQVEKKMQVAADEQKKVIDDAGK